jgi:tetratricopeptide (TPR) repeat protein
LNIPPAVFLAAVRPGLERQDPDALAQSVLARWRPVELGGLLNQPAEQVRRAAALVLGLVGDRDCIGPLSRSLRDADAQVREMAEHALWSIWFRQGTGPAAEAFAHGVELMGQEQHRQAIGAFRTALGHDPDFSEAHNQLAIAAYLLGDFEQSIRHCREAVRRVPTHFGALAGEGHCHAHLGDYAAALDCYERALCVNPHMPEIRQAARQLTRKLSQTPEPVPLDSRF